MRTIATAMEAYAIDFNGRYPILNGYAGTSYSSNLDRGGVYVATGLSTPVAYLTSTAMPDPFNKKKDHDIFGEIDNTGKPGDNGAESYTYHYVNVIRCRKEYWKLPPDSRPAYFLFSFGPDYVKGPNAEPGQNPNNWMMGNYNKSSLGRKYNKFAPWEYDPSNGTVSAGDILRWD
jgi:hypothetical protein